MSNENIDPKLIVPVIAGPTISTNDRITAQIAISHQNVAINPVVADCMFQQMLEYTEQPYVRLMKLEAGKSHALDFGWLKDKAGYVVIKNTTGLGRQVAPNKAEEASLRAAVLRVGADGWVVCPGRCFVADASALGPVVHATAPHTSVEYVITVFPR